MVGALAIQTLNQLTATGCHGGGLMVLLMFAAQLVPQALLMIAVVALVNLRPGPEKKEIRRVAPGERVLRAPREQP